MRKELKIDKSWTLFLDRDGVINKKLENDYVKNIEEFSFIEGVPEVVAKLNERFGITVIVTNQQGIGKGLMTTEDLQEVHDYMQSELVKKGGKVDKYYHCPDLASKNTKFRKPNTGMAEQARMDFPVIDFKKSIMVGDSLTDMQMGRRLGMFNVFISNQNQLKEADLILPSLVDLEIFLSENS